MTPRGFPRRKFSEEDHLSLFREESSLPHKHIHTVTQDPIDTITPMATSNPVTSTAEFTLKVTHIHTTRLFGIDAHRHSLACVCVCVCVCTKSLQSCSTLCSWAVAHQASLSMGFSGQECWSGLPFSSPEDLPDPVIESGSPALQADL